MVNPSLISDLNFVQKLISFLLISNALLKCVSLCSSINRRDTSQAQLLWNLSHSAIIVCTLPWEISSSFKNLSIAMHVFARMHSFTQAEIWEFVAVNGLLLRSALSISVCLFSNMLHHFAIAWLNFHFHHTLHAIANKFQCSYIFSPTKKNLPNAQFFSLDTTCNCQDIFMTNYQTN